MSGIELDRRPSRRSTALSAAAGTVAAGASAAGTTTGGLVTAAGVAVVVAGVWTGRHRVVDAGGLVAFVGVMLGALSDASAAPVLLGTTASVVAWDAGGNAVSLGRQLGRGADTLRVEAIHALGSAVVGLLGAGVGLALFRAGPRGLPVTTLFVLVVAAALLVAVLSR
ncbi:MAG: hypothetical protein ABEJ40_04870 [Haloarculaceae archaeon]